MQISPTQKMLRKLSRNSMIRTSLAGMSGLTLLVLEQEVGEEDTVMVEDEEDGEHLEEEV